MKTPLACLAGAVALAAAAPAAQRPASGEVTTVVQMSYYAQPGREQDVLENRRLASAVLEKNGVTPGRVMNHVTNSRETRNTESADVVWEGEFPDQASLTRYEEVADKNPDFIAARQKMGTLTRKTERRYFQVH